MGIREEYCMRCGCKLRFDDGVLEDYCPECYKIMILGVKEPKPSDNPYDRVIEILEEILEILKK